MATQSDAPKASAAAAASKAPDADKPVEEARFTNDQLVEGARGLLKSDASAVVGALSSSTRKTHTLAEAEALLKQHLAHEVEHEALPGDQE